MQPFDATIAALSTPPGKGGVALIRISGTEAIRMTEACFLAKNGKKLSDAPSRTAVYGHILFAGEPVDDVLVTLFRAPHSYTGEDMAEITCHGSMLIVKVILSALFKQGARSAERGEFTRRAFMAGKMGLSEAEAIGELLDAKSFSQLKLFEKDARSKLSRALGDAYEALAMLLSTVYAKIDYPDEDLADLSDAQIIQKAEEIQGKCRALSATYATGKAIAEGIPTVLLGKPNTGKSSLYNLLCGKDMAIVTDIAGTTRDVLEATVSADRVLLHLCDTAGVRDTVDPIEKIGVAKSREAAENASLLLVLFDASAPFDAEDEALLAYVKELSGEKIALLNKSDLANRFDASLLDTVFDTVLPISVKNEELGALFSLINARFTDEKIKIGEDAVLSSARQYAAVENAISYLQNALDALRAGQAVDAAASDLELALGALAETDGRAVSDDVVAHIFGKFCVGK